MGISISCNRRRLKKIFWKVNKDIILKQQLLGGLHKNLKVILLLLFPLLQLILLIQLPPEPDSHVIYFIQYKDKCILENEMPNEWNGSQVWGEYCNDFYILFSRQQHFKYLITVIPKPSWGLWFIPHRQIPLTDFRFQSHSLTWSFLLKNPPPWVLSNLPSSRICVVCGCFWCNFWAREKTLEFLYEESREVQDNYSKKSEGVHLVLDKFYWCMLQHKTYCVKLFLFPLFWMYFLTVIWTGFFGFSFLSSLCTWGRLQICPSCANTGVIRYILFIITGYKHKCIICFTAYKLDWGCNCWTEPLKVIYLAHTLIVSD